MAILKTRSKTGCLTCRRRKKTCTEDRPACSGCRRNQLECAWPSSSSTTSSSGATKQASNVSDASDSTSCATCQPPLLPHPPSQPSPPALAEPLHSLSAPSRPSPSSSSSYSSSPSSSASACAWDDDPSELAPTAPTASANDHVDRIAPDRHQVTAQLTSLPMLPLQSSQDSFHLLSNYLARTANSMGNGSTASNPFITLVVPLAFSEPLLLQLILVQSAAHRHVIDHNRGSGYRLARRVYAESLHAFRLVLNDYVNGKRNDGLVPTLGSLRLSLTEVHLNVTTPPVPTLTVLQVARGDVLGTTFHLIAAAKLLLVSMLNQSNCGTPADVVDFLVKYHIHMTTLSLISVPSEASCSAQTVSHLHGVDRVGVSRGAERGLEV